VKFSRQPDPDTQDQHIADVSAASAIMLCSGQGWQGLVLTYLKRTTGYSRQQGTRLVSKYHYTGIRKD